MTQTEDFLLIRIALVFLCGPLRISAVNGIFNAKSQEIRRGPQRKSPSRVDFLCKAFPHECNTDALPINSQAGGHLLLGHTG